MASNSGPILSPGPLTGNKLAGLPDKQLQRSQRAALDLSMVPLCSSRDQAHCDGGACFTSTGPHVPPCAVSGCSWQQPQCNAMLAQQLQPHQQQQQPASMDPVHNVQQQWMKAMVQLQAAQAPAPASPAAREDSPMAQAAVPTATAAEAAVAGLSQAMGDAVQAVKALLVVARDTVSPTLASVIKHELLLLVETAAAAAVSSGTHFSVPETLQSMLPELQALVQQAADTAATLRAAAAVSAAEQLAAWYSQQVVAAAIAGLKDVMSGWAAKLIIECDGCTDEIMPEFLPSQQLIQLHQQYQQPCVKQ